MSADHSPLPWTVRPCERDGESVISGAEPRDANGRTVFTVDLGDYCGLSEETAALIVTAVNAHQSLLDICKDIQSRFTSEGTYDERLNAAIALAEVK